MARYYLYILRGLNALVYVFIILIFSSIFDFGAVITTSQEELVIISFFKGIINMFTYLFYILFYIVIFSFAYIITFILGVFPQFNSQYMFSFIDDFFYNYFSLWFRFPSGTVPELFEVPALIINELLGFTSDFYLLIFQILILFSIISVIRSIFNSDPKFTLMSVGSTVLMIVFPLMIFGFRDMLHLFNLRVEYFESLVNPVNVGLSSIPMDNFFVFLSSPAAILAIVCYIYLEFSFQINYIDNVTNPTLERKSRLEAQLEILERESINITANVDKIKEEAKKKREELGLEGIKISKVFAKTTQKISYIREMIERKKLETEEKKLITAASKTRRLGRYIDRLFKEDKDARDTLTAKSSAPKAKSLILSTIGIVLYRLILLVLISFVVIHPQWFFVKVFDLPESITHSVAIYSPEVILVLLLPILLLFPVISRIISYIKHRALILRLKQEGKIKEILASVGDYVRVSEVEEEEGSEVSETPTVGTT